MGLTGLSGHIQAALSATTGWHFKQARLLCRSKHASGRDLLHVLPVKNNTDEKLRSSQMKPVIEHTPESESGNNHLQLRLLLTRRGGT